MSLKGNTIYFNCPAGASSSGRSPRRCVVPESTKAHIAGKNRQFVAVLCDKCQAASRIQSPKMRIPSTAESIGCRSKHHSLRLLLSFPGQTDPPFYDILPTGTTVLPLN